MHANNRLCWRVTVDYHLTCYDSHDDIVLHQQSSVIPLFRFTEILTATGDPSRTQHNNPRLMNDLSYNNSIFELSGIGERL